MDLVAQVATFPKPGETTFGTRFQTLPGGKGANQAMAAGRFAKPTDADSQSPVSLIGLTGDDDFGLTLRGHLAPWVDTLYVGIDPDHRTGVAIILVDDSGQNQITVIPGANGALSNGFVHASLQELKPTVVLASLEIPVDAVTIAAHAVPESATFILNPAHARELPSALMERVDIITPNETEAEILTGIPVTDQSSQSACAKALRQLGAHTAIITLGAAGVFVQTADEEFTVAAPIVDVIDTTGAGDCFNGVLAAALAEGMSLPESIRVAVRAASLSVQKNGALASMPARHELISD